MSESSSSFYCNSSKIKIPTETIQEMFGFINKTNEITCPIDIVKGTLIIDTKNITEGTDVEYEHKGVVKVRKNVLQKAKFNIFHTHPTGSKPYPSVEDIIKVFKHYNTICNSFIATKWGLWIISNSPQSNYYSAKNTNDKEKLHKFLDDSLAYFYKMDKQDPDFIPEEKDIEFINERADKISKKTYIRIKFYSWVDLLSTSDFTIST